MEEIIDILNSTDDIYTFVSNLTIPTLENIIVYTTDKYHSGNPSIEDSVFDILVDFLRNKSPKSKVLKNIGAPVKSKDKVKLPYHLGSMDKIKPDNINKFEKWIEDYPKPYILTDKLDGVSGLLVYYMESSASHNIKLYTRGTATHGMDISILLNYIPNIPTFEVVKAKFENKIVAFRGELILSKTLFDKNWAASMKNARNAISGLVNSKSINPMLAHDTKFVVYQIIDPNYKMTYQLEIIKELGFDTVHSKIINSITFERLSEYLLKRREMSKYIIDGIIVTNNSIHPINKNGNPDFAFAFKDVLEDQKAITTVISVEWNESKDGYLVPTIIVKPIDIGGVTIKRVTGNNAKNILDNLIGVGAVVEVIRSNDVIPKIEKVIKVGKVILPSGDNWKWSESGVHIISTNSESREMKIKSIYHFFSTLDAMGLGEKVVEKLYNASHDTIEKILKLKESDIMKIDGFKEKSANNTYLSIQKSVSNIKLATLMVASNKLGHGIGSERINNILEMYPNLFVIYKKYSKKEFIELIKMVDNIDDKIATLFVSNFNTFIDFYNSIKNMITINTEIVKKNTLGKMSGMKIVLSGFRDKNLQEMIVNEGGTIVNIISKNTDLLVIRNKEQDDTSKVIKAKEMGINIITLDDFKKKYPL